MKFVLKTASRTRVGTWVVHHGPLPVGKFKSAILNILEEFERDHSDGEMPFDDWMIKFEKWLKKEGLMQ